MKLTSEQVKNIRYLYYRQGHKQIELANQFGVNQGLISRIVRGLRYSKV
jgi:DNA-binding transcriptional regulator LsrR (DeoR family)